MTTHRRGQLLIALAATAWSTAGLFQRGLHDGVTTPTQIAGRAFFAALALTVLAWFETRRFGTTIARSIDRSIIAMALCMGLASASFVFALNHASVANVLFMQALSPFVAMFLAYFFLKEPTTLRMALAAGAALLGVGLMMGGESSVVGMAAAFVMAVLFGTSMVIARHRKETTMAPGSMLAMWLIVAIFAPFADFSVLNAKDVALLVAMGFIQMGIGQASFVAGARLIPAGEVGVISLLEIVLGTLWVALAFQEYPKETLTWIGAALVLAAVVYQALDRTPPTAPTDAAIDAATEAAPSISAA